MKATDDTDIEGDWSWSAIFLIIWDQRIESALGLRLPAEDDLETYAHGKTKSVWLRF